MEFKEPEVFEISVEDEQRDYGKLRKINETWEFRPEEYETFTASDLRQIADKLDELNKVEPRTPGEVRE